MLIIRRLIPYVKAHWGRLAMALVSMSITGSLAAVSMWALKEVVDLALNNRDQAILLDCVVLVIAIYVVNGIFNYIQVYLTNYVGQSAIRKIRDDVYGHLHTLSMNYFTTNASAKIMSRMTNDMTTLQYILTGAPTTLIKDGMSVLGLIGFLFFLSWRFALLALTIMPLAATLLMRFGRKGRSAGRDGQVKMADLYHLLQEALTAMPVVKAFQQERWEWERFKKENRHFFDISMRLVRTQALSSPVMEFVVALAIAGLLWVGGLNVIKNVWTVGSFVAFIGGALSLYKPLKNFSNMNVSIQQSLAAGERIFQLLDQESAVKERLQPVALSSFSHDIQFDHVTFHYRMGEPVLEDINLSVRRGEVVALVGPSGSGKTTFVHLLLRFYDPREGAIRIDNHDLRDLSLDSLRRQMGIVTQDTHLFNDTVASNIAYGEPSAGRRKIEEAAKVANAHNFIARLPRGYDTVIGEKGVFLSGGEKQRLAIARAILKNPPILILDEATSALDAISEALVQEAFERVLSGRTVFMIAHRLATVKKANRIIVLKKGRIVQMGTQDELLKQVGPYQELYGLQVLK
jgi:subfamily B ATP-binding cassette protein MsbA